MPVAAKSPGAMTIRFNDTYTHELARVAAEMEGQSMSGFIMSAIRAYGEKILSERNRAMQEFGPIVLPPEDYEALMASMEDPGGPNPALRDAMKRFKESGIEWQGGV